MAKMRARACVCLFTGLASFGASACDPVVTSAYTELHDGVFCLASDIQGVELYLSGNTTLDCKGHKAGGVQATEGDNIVVKNCVFDGAVHFVLTSNYRIVDNVFPDAPDRAIYANGTQGLIARNTIRKRVPSDASWAGIVTFGSVDIVGNTVLSGNPSGTAGNGISVGGTGGLIAYNLVQTISNADDRGYSLAVDWDSRSIIYRNVLVNPAGSGREGMLCGGSPSEQNLVVGFDLPYANCAVPANPPGSG